MFDGPQYPHLDSLNASQLTAATCDPEHFPVLQILAGPGSGKTRVLTTRVAHLLLHHGLPPSSIIVATFTNKAAKEMKERIHRILGVENSGLILGTFHSVACRYLKKYGDHIGLEKDFGIADANQTTTLMKMAIKQANSEISDKVAKNLISQLKSKGITCQQHAVSEARKRRSSKFPHYAGNSKANNDVVDVYTEYETLLKQQNLFDFDDILIKCLDLLKERPQCVGNIQHVLVDEYQDTNFVQYELMRLFAQKAKRITIVGDPDQSIYGFRSADITNLEKMSTHYRDQGVAVINLEDNYRSSGAILKLASQVISQDRSRPQKQLMPNRPDGPKPVLRVLADPTLETEWIAREIKRVIACTGGMITYNDVAVLLRSARPTLMRLETAFTHAGIPFHVVGSFEFFQRKEVQDILAYLRVIQSSSDLASFTRVINVPARGLGPKTLEKLLALAQTRGLPVFEAANRAAKGELAFANTALKSLQDFVLVINKARAMANNNASVEELIKFITANINYREYLEKTCRKDGEEGYLEKWANVEELSIYADQVSAAIAEDLPDVEGIDGKIADMSNLEVFLSGVSLVSDRVEKGGEAIQRVTVSTIHASKGLEWPVVFIPAAYDGSIPNSRAEDQDEERRILYVGQTRAQALLYHSYPEMSMNYGQQEDARVSPFLNDVRERKLLQARGPSFAGGLATEVSRLLDRPMPSLEKIGEMTSRLSSVEDEGLGGASSPVRGRRNDFEQNLFHKFSPERVMRRQYSTVSSSTDGISHEQSGFMSSRTALNQLPVEQLSAGNNRRAASADRREKPITLKKQKTDSKQGVLADWLAAKRQAKAPSHGQSAMLPPVIDLTEEDLPLPTPVGRVETVTTTVGEERYVLLSSSPPRESPAVSRSRVVSKGSQHTKMTYTGPAPATYTAPAPTPAQLRPTLPQGTSLLGNTGVRKPGKRLGMGRPKPWGSK
ncbi:ATP-dependent DNA helicase srs2 [Saitoella coloradoensis]